MHIPGHSANEQPHQDGSGHCLPLSSAQQRLWLTQKLSGSHGQVTLRVLRLSGEPDPVVLERSLREIVGRHDILRVSFGEKDGSPYQVISPEVGIDLEQVDLTCRRIDDRGAEVRRIATEAAYLDIDPSKRPLASFKLFKLAANDHLLVMATHHLINDGWSWGIFGREFEQLYSAGLRGETTRLPPLRIRYWDYIRAGQAADGGRASSTLGYWRSRLDGITPVELPTDRILPVSPSHVGSQQSLVLDPAIVRSIRRLAAKEQCTPFVVFLTVLNVLLYRCSGQEDITLGIITSGRRGHREVHDLIGYFINIFLLRTGLRGPLTFRELLSRVRKNLEADLPRSDLPFEKLVEVLKPDRHGSYNSLLHVLLNYKKAGWSNFRLQGVGVEPVDVLEQPAHVPLQLNIEEKKDGIFVQFLYQRAIFSDARMEHFLSQYVHLLEQSLDGPERDVGDYSLVTQESTGILTDPGAALDQPRYESVISRFVNVAERYGEIAAVEHRGRRCTYTDLLRRVDALASMLQAGGYGDGKVVAVTGERCIGLVTALVAVMAGGGVVLPVDPVLPWRRRRLVFQRADVRLVLALGEVSENEADWFARRGIPVWNVDPESGQPDAVGWLPGPGRGLRVATPEDPAYIFFTSGSTGEPKGVLGLHKGVDHFIDWQARQFSIGRGDRVAQLAHLSFDVLLREVYLPLATGGTVCIPSESENVNVLRWLDDARITVIHTVPTLANAWLDDVPAGARELACLRWVFFSGESLSDSLVTRWRDTFPAGGRIVSFYGPTETTMIKSWYPVPPEPVPGVQPLGEPLPQTQVLVMNAGEHLCGVGESGEIVVRTPYGTAGYLGSSHVNGQRFRPNPYTKDAGDVVYFTGDRGSYTVDGMIEIHGRMDHQFKIRGVRAEPEEIEQVMLQNDSVQACVVAPCRSDDGQCRIVAYVVGAGRSQPDVEKLRIFAQERLPLPLVPSTFQSVEKIPRLPNGKIDRNAMPAPERPERKRNYVAPRTRVEIRLAEIWEAMLGVSEIGLDDNFLELGGHSLTAIQLVSRLNEVFDVDLSFAGVFESPTLGNLARVISQATRTS